MTWKTINSEILEKNEWITLRKDTCETVAGKKVDAYYVLEMGDVSCILALTKDKKAVVVKEYKHGTKEIITQFPSGYLDDGESALQAAKRELEEETGYTAPKWISLGRAPSSPGRITQYYNFFLALDAQKTSDVKHDELESLEVQEVPFGKLKEHIDAHVSEMACYAIMNLAREHLEPQ